MCLTHFTMVTKRHCRATRWGKDRHPIRCGGCCWCFLGTHTLISDVETNVKLPLIKLAAHPKKGRRVNKAERLSGPHRKLHPGELSAPESNT